MASRAFFLMLALGCVVVAGCRHPWKRQPPAPCPPGGALIPPVGIPDGPPPAPVPRGVAPDGGSELLLPQAPPPGRARSEYPRIVPADPRGAIIGSPDYFERPRIVGPDAPVESRKPIPPVEVAIGITDFTPVKEGVSTGQRPTLDGLDWLKAAGYKTAVYLRGANDDDTTDRRQVERRDMKFVSLLVTPDTLTATWIDEFNQLVGDTGSRPIFIYSTDPEVAGVVWYLHLRTAEFLTHDEARVRAGRQGRIDEKSALFQAAVKALAMKQ